MIRNCNGFYFIFNIESYYFFLDVFSYYSLINVLNKIKKNKMKLAKIVILKKNYDSNGTGSAKRHLIRNGMQKFVKLLYINSNPL